MNKMLVTEAFSDIYNLVDENSIINKNINYVLSKKYPTEDSFDMAVIQNKVMDKLSYTNKAKEEFNSNMALILNIYKNKYLFVLITLIKNIIFPNYRNIILYFI